MRIIENRNKSVVNIVYVQIRKMNLQNVCVSNSENQQH